MTTFEDGPAAGQRLMLQRAPRFLRVTQQGGAFDALDLVNDTPKPEEKLFAYEVVGIPGRVHIYKRGGGGGWYAFAQYRFVTLQPPDAVMRNFEEWCQWCHERANFDAPVEL